MTVNLPCGFVGQPLTDFGIGPGSDFGIPIWRSTQIVPTVANVQQIIDKADQYDMVLLANFSGNRDAWTNKDANGFLIFDFAKYKAAIDKFAGMANVVDAINRRRFINFVVDEPYLIKVFNGSIPKPTQNDMGLYHKQVFGNNALTFIRANANRMSPPPTGGWTGIDYAGCQWEREAIVTGMTKTAWFADQRTKCAAMNIGMVPMINWADGGDGRLWDYLNNGTSSGNVVGDDGSPFWLMSPPEVRELADVLWNDPDAPLVGGYSYVTATNQVSEALPYWNRSDEVAAFDYMLNKFATRPTFNGFRVAKGTVGGGGGGGQAGEVGHFVSAVSTSQAVVLGAYTDITDAIVPTLNMTPGKTYLVVATGEFGWNSTTAEASVRVVAGSNVLSRSESAWRSSNLNSSYPYFYWGIYTAVSGEDLKMQCKSSDGTSTITAKRCQLLVVNLSDDLVNGADYKVAESSASTVLTGTFQDGASVALTPQNAGDNWLVLTAAHYTGVPQTSGVVSGLRRGGEAVESDPQVQAEGKDSRDIYRLCTAKVVALGNTNNTLAEQSKNSVSGGGTRDGSAVFALRLNRFVNPGFAYNTTDVAPSTSNYATNLGTTAVTPSAIGDVWLLASLGISVPSVGTGIRARVQVDNADQPAGQTTGAVLLTSSMDVTDVLPVVLSNVVDNMSAAAHTVDLDGSVSSVGSGGVARNCLILALPFKLVSVSSSGNVVFRRSGQDGLGTRAGTRKLR